MIRWFKQHVRRKLLSSLGVYEQVTYGKVAFAQEGEDVLLWRIIENHQNGPGTFVDVGCNHPWSHSNTALFYLKGWSGVAIDPNPDFGDEFAASRPRDVFVNAGISDERGILRYHRFDQPLYNTFCEERRMELESRKISALRESVDVEVRPLREVLHTVWGTGKPIDLLSIDAEGFDERILRSHDFERFPVRFVYVEFQTVRLDDLMSDPVMELLQLHSFRLVAKLWKSGLFMHCDVLDEL